MAKVIINYISERKVSRFTGFHSNVYSLACHCSKDSLKIFLKICESQDNFPTQLLSFTALKNS